MDMPKLLIADSNDDFRQVLCDLLSDICIVQSCSTGKQALELLQAFRPNILILDLLLPEIDGLTLLQRAHALGIHPAALTLSPFYSPYTSSACAKLGVCYMLNTPCDPLAIVAHVRDLAAELEPTPVNQLDIRSVLTNQLMHYNLSVKLDGFTYLLAAIPLFSEDPSQTVTKELYPAVAKLYNKEPKQVERSIRNAVHRAWDKRDERTWRQAFPTAPGCPVPRPSNKVFIVRMIELLRQQQTYSWHSA